ncbi:DNA polymerase III subunit delta' [soil metagenome]
MLFQSIIGQKDIKVHLMHMIQQNRLSHALLFLGKEGVGALPLAIAFANYLSLPKNAVPKKKEASLFGEAPEEVLATTVPTTPAEIDNWMQQQQGWGKVKDMVHPDIHFSYPVIPRKSGDKPISTDYIKEWREFISTNPYGNVYDWLQFIGAENKQGNITAHECSDIIRKMNLKSFESEYKILIMWMPELLGKEGNKLLKLIEEPPPDTLFILVAENDSLILPTILSRTQLIKIPQLSALDIESALELRQGISSQKAQQVAAISSGNYHEAIQQLQHAEDDWEVFLRDWLNSIVKTGPVAQVKWIEEISKIGREKQKQFLKYFVHILEMATRLRVIPSQSDQLERADVAFALKFNKLCDITQQEAIVHELDQAAYYIERNANAKILFHALTIKLYHIISNKSVILMQ